jgi:hypothetical protein
VLPSARADEAAASRCQAAVPDRPAAPYARNPPPAVEGTAFRLIGLRYSQDAIHNAYLAAESGKPDRTSAAHEYLDSALDRETKRALLPLLDSPDRLESHARDLFHIEPKSAEAALRELLASGDSWITLCAMASAAELQLKGLAAISRVRASARKRFG